MWYNRLMSFNWQHKDWPNFSCDLSSLEQSLLLFSERMGRSSGLFVGLSEDDQTASMIDMMVVEAVKTSEIEGEMISRRDVMSSIKNNLGLNPTPEYVQDRRADGVAELMLDVRDSFAQPLSEEKLFAWHRMLMKGDSLVQAGSWRTHEEPMQVVSGPIGRQKVHYEAPPSDRVPSEMKAFVQWFNDTAPGGKTAIVSPSVRAAVAHLYFETIHPFEDGNGRIGRAVSEKALSQGFNRPVLLSLSRAIEADRNAYYDALQSAQSSNELTGWISYFIAMVLDAQAEAEEHVEFTLKKAKLFDRFASELNERQLRVLRRMLEEGPKGFKGGMSAKKYISMTQASKATATRDLQDLARRGIFVAVGGGRSTRYEIDLR